MTPLTPRSALSVWPAWPAPSPSLSLSLLLLVLALGPPILLMVAAGVGLDVARAQSAIVNADQKAEMKLHYERAQRAFDIGKYADAIDEYAKVYEIGGNPSMLFNIAQAHRLNGQVPEALRFYRRYLQRAPNASNKADVEQKIADLEKNPAGARAPTAAAPPPAPAPTPQLTPAPPATPLPPPPPPTSPAPAPVAAAPPPPPASRAPAVEPPPVAPTSPPVSPAATSSDGNGRLIAVIALVAVGAAGMVLAGFEGLNASSKADAISAQSKSGKPFDPAVETAGRRANAIAITSALVGGAALIAGGVLFLTGPRSSGAESTETRVSFAPWLTPGGLVGAGASWTY